MTEQDQKSLESEFLFNKMANFARLGPEGGVNNFCLQGPIDVPTNFHSFVGLFLFLSSSQEKHLVFVSRNPKVNARGYYPKILELDIPERVARLKIDDIFELKTIFEREVALNTIPPVVLGFGKTRETLEEVVVLFVKVGISPADALGELKKTIRARLTKLN